MIRFSVTGDALAIASAWVDRLTPARPDTPSLAGVLIEAADASVYLTVYDFETVARVELPADVDAAGSALVSARLLALVARTITGEPTVTITVDEGWAVIDVGKRAGWELPTMDLALYPQIPEPGPIVGTVDAAALTVALGRVLPVVGEARVAPLFGGVAISGGSTLTLATTDRSRLAVAEIDWSPSAPFQELLVGANLLAVAAAATVGEGDRLALHTDGTSGITVSGPEHRVTGRLIAEETVGQWRQVDNTVAEITTEAVIETEALRRIVRRASVVLDKDEPLIVDVDADEVTVRPAVGGRGRASHSAPVGSFTGQDQSIGVVSGYLDVALDAIAAPHVELGFPARRNAPFLLRGVEDDGTLRGDYRHVIAQFRVIAPRPAEVA